MDEYLFIQLAKLKADRLELEREKRVAAQGLPESTETSSEKSRSTSRRSSRTRWYVSEPEWREQS